MAAEELERGAFVENVHPLNRGRMPLGVVEYVDELPNGLVTVSVRTGRGSHVYGPAANWRRVDRRPEWLELERRCYCPGDCNCRHPWRPNYCGCRGHELERGAVV